MIQELETLRVDAVRAACIERDALACRLEADTARLAHSLSQAQQQHDAALIAAEEDKQQALSLKEAEKVSLAERLALAQREVSDVAMETERMRRAHEAQHESDRAATDRLSSELGSFRALFEDTVGAHERE
ncbi:uncharacterized protein LOC144954034 [Lampetra fluviatilis]